MEGQPEQQQAKPKVSTEPDPSISFLTPPEKSKKSKGASPRTVPPQEWEGWSQEHFPGGLALSAVPQKVQEALLVAWSGGGVRFRGS